MSKHILVLGGSGRTGSLVIEQALAAGHKVTALVRRADSVGLVHDDLTVVVGTAEKPQDLSVAMDGCDAVICTLNNARQSDSPFAKLINSDTLLTDSVRNTVDVMKAQGVTRIAMLGAAGTSETYASAPWIMRMLIKYSNLGQAYRDHEGVEAVLSTSGVDWTIGRAMMLGAKEGRAPIVESYVVDGANTPKPAMQISRAAVAGWLIDSLDRSDLVGKGPLISQK